MTSIYNAIMKAANTVEIQSNWCWTNSRVPDCGTSGCAVGWIGHYLGMKDKGVSDVSYALGFPINDGCHTLYDAIEAHGCKLNSGADTKKVASALRSFAQRFKPAITGIPDSVRQIFAELPGERVS